MVEITSKEQNKVKRMNRTEDSLRDFWDHIKRTNILIIQVPQEEKKMKGYEKSFEEIIVENFPNLEKEMATHSSILVWEITRTEEPAELQPMGLQELDMT